MLRCTYCSHRRRRFAASALAAATKRKRFDHDHPDVRVPEVQQTAARRRQCGRCGRRQNSAGDRDRVVRLFQEGLRRQFGDGREAARRQVGRDGGADLDRLRQGGLRGSGRAGDQDQRNLRQAGDQAFKPVEAAFAKIQAK